MPPGDGDDRVERNQNDGGSRDASERMLEEVRSTPTTWAERVRQMTTQDAHFRYQELLDTPPTAETRMEMRALTDRLFGRQGSNNRGDLGRRLDQLDHNRELFTSADSVLSAGQRFQRDTWRQLDRFMDTPNPAFRGQTPRAAGYELVPIRDGTPMDGIGGDFVLVNTRNGEFLPLDITLQRKTGLPSLRATNVISPNSADHATRMQEVTRAFAQRLESLHQNGSPLNLLEVRLPQRANLPQEDYAREYRNNPNRDWLDIWRRANELEQQGLRDFASDLNAVARRRQGLGQTDVARDLREYARHTLGTAGSDYSRPHLGYLERIMREEIRPELARYESTTGSGTARPRPRITSANDVAGQPSHTQTGDGTYRPTDNTTAQVQEQPRPPASEAELRDAMMQEMTRLRERERAGQLSAEERTRLNELARVEPHLNNPEMLRTIQQELARNPRGPRRGFLSVEGASGLLAVAAIVAAAAHWLNRQNSVQPPVLQPQFGNR